MSMRALPLLTLALPLYVSACAAINPEPGSRVRDASSRVYAAAYPAVVEAARDAIQAAGLEIEEEVDVEKGSRVFVAKRPSKSTVRKAAEISATVLFPMIVLGRRLARGPQHEEPVVVSLQQVDDHRVQLTVRSLAEGPGADRALEPLRESIFEAVAARLGR